MTEHGPAAWQGEAMWAISDEGSETCQSDWRCAAANGLSLRG